MCLSAASFCSCVFYFVSMHRGDCDLFRHLSSQLKIECALKRNKKKTYLAWEKKRNKTNPNFFLPAVSEHGQDAASVRDADCWLWGVLADSAAAHHHLRVRLEVRLTNRLSLRANFAAKAPEWKVTSEFQQVDGQKIGIWLEKLFYFSTNRASETYPCYWRPREMS